MNISKDFKQILKLLKSNDRTNVDLAFEIIKGQPKLIDEFEEMFLVSFAESKDALKDALKDEVLWLINRSTTHTHLPLPPVMQFCDNIDSLHIWPSNTHKEIQDAKLPTWIKDMKLTSIRIKNYKVNKEALKIIAQSKTIDTVVLSNNKIESIPKEFITMKSNGQKTGLIGFNFENNNIKNADPIFLNPNALVLHLKNNPIRSIPKAPNNSKLNELTIDITRKNIKSFIKNIGTYNKLQAVGVKCNLRILRKLKRKEEDFNFEIYYDLNNDKTDIRETFEFRVIFSLYYLLVAIIILSAYGFQIYKFFTQ